MNILALNCGSSSLKFGLYQIDHSTCEIVFSGEIESIGTKYTIQARFYPDAIKRIGLELVIPNESEIAAIHNIYFNELLYNQFKPESRQAILQVVQRLRHTAQIDGLILGGTELPLLLRESTVPGVTFLDTTRIHVERIVEELLAGIE